MSLWNYIVSGLWHYRRVQLAVGLGVAVATAVITGALLVGDSVRGSLRDLALERLGTLDTVLIAEQPFRRALSEQLRDSTAFEDGWNHIAPLLIVPGSASSTGQDRSLNVNQISIIGCQPGFWEFGDVLPAPELEGGVAISTTLAKELQVQVGDEVLLRVPRMQSLPAESSLGEKSETTSIRRVTVGTVLPDEGLARFGLQPSQLPPRNVFVKLEALQRQLQIDDRANALAIGTGLLEQAASDQAFAELRSALEPTLADFNIELGRFPKEGEPRYLRIASNQLVLPDSIVSSIRYTFPEAPLQAVITYLANTLQKDESSIPYSTITGVDSIPQIGPLLNEAGDPIQLADDEIALIDWAAEDLGAEVGDTITFTYYQPETTHGQLQVAEPVELTLRAIVPLANDAGEPTAAADPNLTPELEGVTDQRTIRDWELPFELVEEIRPKDEEYWEEHSTTPKAYISHSLAERLWSTRWGTESVLRIPLSAGIAAEEIHQQVQLDPAANGMMLMRVKQESLEAATGTTPFEGLFLGFSFFLMASALMLVALLFRLGIENRAGEVGLLAAIGFSPQRLRQFGLGEGLLVALGGSLLGAIAGIAYARLMIYGLSTWWVEATVTPFLSLHVRPLSLLLGLVVGVVIAMLTIWWSLRKMVHLPARQLLTGDASDPRDRPGISDPSWHWLPWLLLILALGLTAWATRLEGEAHAGAFFGAGALVLTGLLVGLRQRLRKPSLRVPSALSLAGLAARNARRNPSRTILSIGLAAVASFLIIALSAFRLAPTEAGTGGFDLMATAAHPIHYNLDTRSGREELGFRAADNQQFEGVAVVGCRVHAGEDASCLNLYQTTQPQVVAIPGEFYDENQFGWASTAELAEGETPWHLLERDLGSDDRGRPIVPMILDKNTATYSLHLRGIGSQFVIDDTFDRPVTLEIVALLSGSVLQGSVLVGEDRFLEIFPENSGERLFLLRTKNEYAEQIAALLETRLQDYGFDVVSTEKKLAAYMAVQNTYLSTFQSLGGLGLLLGTVGLAVAQLRSVMERRGEIALMRSAGFKRSRIAEMVLGENTVLLLGGLGIGLLAALVAVLPHWLFGEADIPWTTLAGLLLVIALVGLTAGWMAVRAATRAPLLAALRGD